MKVIIIDKDDFNQIVFNQVSNIAYDDTTKIVTITYGSGTTVTYSLENFLISVLW